MLDAYLYAEYLVGAGGADIDIADQNKNTALHVACRQVRRRSLFFCRIHSMKRLGLSGQSKISLALLIFPCGENEAGTPRKTNVLSLNCQE